MNALTSTMLTALIVIGGRWADDKKLNIQVVVGLMFMGISLALLSEANEKFARQFGLLIVAGAVFVYGGQIVGKSGLTGKKLGSQGKIGGSL